MHVCQTIPEIRTICTQARKSGARIGLVPTMGALHKGHTSLLDRARRLCDMLVMSIYVNPTQFGPNEDYHSYPRMQECDITIAREHHCDAVFAPPDSEMYPPDYSTWVTVENLTDVLCGRTRPGHFRGVTTIVTKLFNAIMPDVAVFGQKDAQQVLIIKRMVRDLHIPVEIDIVPTIREEDGLAVSSRNSYLTTEERKEAPIIYHALQQAAGDFTNGVYDTETLKKSLRSTLSTCRYFVPEYIEILRADTLEPIRTAEHTPLLMAVACRSSESDTRLIDNIICNGPLQ